MFINVISMGRNHTLFKNVRINLLFIGQQISFIERARKDSDNLLSPSVEDKNAWSYNCNPPYTFKA
jgi:hypothetical protein